ncbi:SpoIIE family protein phosphatase [Peterkaempfera bronchialis]|uniref:protein-serine/threonine phosphatase n=1 Tax=Peterkaempfera bronchialis TaxID=2126346 RepID=A0A345SS60_9ACTN|nr:SpoIIE family protein phosphatase [Peterkaempfera bronchialis]AXI76565.1 PAS domain S-box protein [Peterkaempfera bronchialis]
MSATEVSRAGPPPPGGALTVLDPSALVLDADGRVVLWGPQAQELFGHTAEDALGRPVGALLVDPQHRASAVELFTGAVAEGVARSGTVPVRHRDGSTRLVQFRTMRLRGADGGYFALGIATDQAALLRVERDLALSERLVSQSPIGLAVLDPELRYLMVNPTLERLNGLSGRHLGLTVREALSFMDAEPVEADMERVLATGVPLVNRFSVGPTPADPGREHAWSASYHRLEDRGGRVLGLAVSVVDVTEQHQATLEAAAARRRLAQVADASVRIGSTLDLDTTADELAEVCVPDLADLAAVHVLDCVPAGRGEGVAVPEGSPRAFRPPSVASAGPSPVASALGGAGGPVRCAAERLITRCVNAALPIRLSRLDRRDLAHIAPDPQSAALLARAGAHSYLAVPLIVRGRVLGALDLVRCGNPVPFDEDDVVLATELAARAAVCVEHARWYQHQRHTAETLQRSLLPHRPPHQAGLEIAVRYQAAEAVCDIGGDWYDAIPLPDGKTALIIGDVMGSGISAAATMGQLRTATRTLAALDLEPAAVLSHLDRITADLDHRFATCVYAVHDPQRSQCRISSAGHLPPVLVRPGRAAPALLDLPTGAPLGVGGVPFETTCLDLAAGDRLVLYTDGLVETRDQPIDARLAALLLLLERHRLPLEETCDLLLRALRRPGDPDDVAVLIASVQPPG